MTRPIVAILGHPSRPGEAHSPSSHRQAIADGFRALGFDVIETPSPIPDSRTRYVVCWGWRRGQALRSRGYEVLVMERGYIGDRFHYTSLGWNGLNNHAVFPEYPDDGGERFRAHGGVLKPWKEGGNYALILGQVKNDASLKGLYIGPWYSTIAKRITKTHGIDVYFRPHPEARRRGGYLSIEGAPIMSGSLEASLDGALFTAAYNSNSCLDSILHGVPTYAGDSGTMAWGMHMPTLDEIVRPQREPIVHQIAWRQWSMEEIRSGYPLEALWRIRRK